jgi:GTPase SAR1 family protein
MASLSGTTYDFSRKKLNEIMKALRDCGTEEVVKLPKIVVIGNQSAGKSSLIEAISQIKVPRAAGTCTRCPMEVILSCGDPDKWHCKVSLRLENSDVPGQRLGTFRFGKTSSKDEVALLLRQAQLAILNPTTNFNSFTKFTENDCIGHRREKNFSSNTVVLEITGAEVDVTFLDLPGIISNTEKVKAPVNWLSF